MEWILSSLQDLLCGTEQPPLQHTTTPNFERQPMYYIVVSHVLVCVYLLYCHTVFMFDYTYYVILCYVMSKCSKFNRSICLCHEASLG